MRIVHLGKYYPPASGGIETLTRTLATAQVELGADVTVVAINHADARGRDVSFEAFAATPTVADTDGGVRVHRVGRVSNVARLDVAPGLHRLLVRLGRTRPDVWHLHTPNPTMLLALATAPRLRPLVITHHSDIVRQRLLRHLQRPIERVVYGRADRLLVNSPGYEEGSAALVPLKARVRTLVMGVDLAPFTDPSPGAIAAGERTRAAHAGPIWLAVGRLIYYKALDVAIEALVGVPGTLVVVGAGPMEATWRALASRLGVSDRVVWRGSVPFEELVGLYHAATALWFPSNARSEAFGLVQVEAMASGCPVINADIPHSGVSWVSRHEVTGLTVPIDDPSAFAGAARRIAGDPALRGRLSRSAIESARERFDHRTMARASLDLYAEVAGRPRRERRTGATWAS